MKHHHSHDPPTKEKIIGGSCVMDAHGGSPLPFFLLHFFKEDGGRKEHSTSPTTLLSFSFPKEKEEEKCRLVDELCG